MPSPLEVIADEVGMTLGQIERDVRQKVDAIVSAGQARVAELVAEMLRADRAREERTAARLAELWEKPTITALPACEPWVERVYYENEMATVGGSSYQAVRDTGRAPPHDDWRLIAGRGADGRTPAVRGTFDAAREDYAELDIVMLNGSSFVARHDAPGLCPGDGWQLIASAGKRGQVVQVPSPRSAPVPAAAVVSGDLDVKAMTLVLTNANGTTVEVDLYPLAEAIRSAL